MPTIARYRLPKKALKGDCPQCGHRRTLSRYVDTQTDEPLPAIYGRCDRESNCGYHLNPYHKGPSGLSYADEVNEHNGVGPIPKAWFRMAGKWKRNATTRQGVVMGLQSDLVGATPQQAERVAAFIFDQPARPLKVQQPAPVYTLPEEVFIQSLGHYERNQFARLLRQQLGLGVADSLLDRFHIGTSSRWPGACVFWYIDEQERRRGGQIKLFDDTFHTVKYLDGEGKTRSKTSWVHSALIRKYNQMQTPLPEWLTLYDEHAERSPCLFGLPQLKTAPIDQPIALCEAPKTAVLCTPYFPGFVWMAVGALSYLNAERLAPLKGRDITLFPDASDGGRAFDLWSRKAEELQQQGYQISINHYLEEATTAEQKKKGWDLADLILEEWPGYPPDWDSQPGQTPNYQMVPNPDGAFYAQYLPISPSQVFMFIHQLKK